MMFHATEMPPEILNYSFGLYVNDLNSETVYDEINKESGEYIIRLHNLVNCKTRGKYINEKKRQKSANE